MLPRNLEAEIKDDISIKPPRRSARQRKPSAKLCSTLEVQGLKLLNPASKRKRSSSPDCSETMPLSPHKRHLPQSCPSVLSDNSPSSHNPASGSSTNYSTSSSASSPSISFFLTPPSPLCHQPIPIRLLRPIHTNPTLPSNPSTFTLPFLKTALKGTPLTESIYHSTDPTNPVPAWRFFVSTYQPFLPRTPGHNGAGLTLFVHPNPPPDLEEGGIPLFVGTATARYTYFGHYHEPRPAEMLTLEELVKLPGWVKGHFEREAGRMETPGWVDRGLKEALFGGTGEGRVEEVERIRVCARIVEEKAMPPSETEALNLQLSWEYLECIGFNMEFFEALVERQRRVEKV